MSVESLPGIRAIDVDTSRCRTHALVSGRDDGVPVVFVHGNLTTSRFFASTLAALPDRYRGIALDLRGFGGTDPCPIDATRGLRDWSDDLAAFVEALGLEGPVHFVGWSMGGGILFQYAMDRPDRVAGLALAAPMSPFGFGGTRDAAGTPTYPDHGASGAATAAPEYVQRLRDGDRSSDSNLSPRPLMKAFFMGPNIELAPDEEEALLDSVLSTRVGDDFYPGDGGASEHWPGVAPGTRGINNAFSPKYCDVSGFASIDPKPPVLWVRGTNDQVISDTSLFDFGYLGQIGAVPGWPGAELHPPQPMVGQLRAMFDAYVAGGGSVREEVFPDTGHCPFLERPAEFQRLLLEHLER